SVTTMVASARKEYGATDRVYSPRACSAPRRVSMVPVTTHRSAAMTLIPKKRIAPATSSVDGGKNRVVKSPQYGNHSIVRVALKRGRARRSAGGDTGHNRINAGRQSRQRKPEATFTRSSAGPSTC